MEENKDSVIAELKKQVETKSCLLESMKNVLVLNDKKIVSLEDRLRHLEGASQEAAESRRKLKDLQEKFDKLKYYGRDTDVEFLKREVNNLRDYIDICYKHMGYLDVLKIESDFCFIHSDVRYKL